MRRMSLVETVALDKLSPARLWAQLDAETRRAAVRALYAPQWDDDASRIEADVAIAAALRFRPIAVRKLPVAKRIDHLCRAVRPGESLSTSLLRALHLVERRAMLGAFLDALGIPQKDGLITEETNPPAPTAAAVAGAAAKLREHHSPAEVELYLLSLVALDPDFWKGVGEYLRTGGA